MERDHPSPILKTEILELLKKEDSMCKIKSPKIFNGEITQLSGSGFFLELNDKSIPFSKCLMACNHLLSENDIEIGKEINLEYLSKKKILKITKNRRVFTSRELDYTLIEILPEDKLKNFFQVDMNPIDYYKGRDIFLLQYPQENELGYSCGKILKTKDKWILHNCSTNYGSAGGPLILRSKELSVIGIHFGKRPKYRISTFIQSIINDIKNKSVIFKLIDYKEKYKNLEKLGNGNFGTVYKGKIDKENFRALKIIDKEEMRNRIRISENKEDIEEEFKINVHER